MKPESYVPYNVTKRGIGFGYRILINQDLTPTSQFVFGFSSFAQYSVLVNPSNPLAMKAIKTMIEERRYILLILNPNQCAFAFRCDIGERNLASMRDHLPVMQRKKTPQSSYESGVQKFRRTPYPPHLKSLEWVCRDNPAYFDLESDTTDLPPLG